MGEVAVGGGGGEGEVEGGLGVRRIRAGGCRIRGGGATKGEG